MSDDLTSHLHGTVKWYSIARGYGFIVPETGGDDVFVHYTAIEDEEKLLTEGERVWFELVEAPKGFRAQKVVRLAKRQGE